MSTGGRVSCLNFLNIFYTFVKKKKKNESITVVRLVEWKARLLRELALRV